MGLIKRKKCKNCGCLFIPDARNAKRQQYCGKPACRRASKAASQQRWLLKPENQDYFRGPDNVARVQRWREANPGYWQRKSEKRQNALQDSLNEQAPDINTDKVDFALQDPLIGQPAVLIGLIANFAGSTLQDDIATTVQRLRQLGRDIVKPLPPRLRSRP